MKVETKRWIREDSMCCCWERMLQRPSSVDGLEALARRCEGSAWAVRRQESADGGAPLVQCCVNTEQGFKPCLQLRGGRKPDTAEFWTHWWLKEWGKSCSNEVGGWEERKRRKLRGDHKDKLLLKQHGSEVSFKCVLNQSLQRSPRFLCVTPVGKQKQCVCGSSCRESFGD